MFSGEHLQSIRAYPFDHRITKDHHVELKNVIDKKKINVIKDQTLTAIGGQTFKSFAKEKSESAQGEMRACLVHFLHLNEPYGL